MADSQRKTENVLNNSNFEQDGWAATTGTIPYKYSNSKRCRYSEFFSILSTIVYYDFKDLNANIIMVDSNGISLGGSGYKTGTGSFALLNNTDKISLIIANTDTTQNITLEKVQSKNISLYYGWVHSLRKLTTATDTFATLPAGIYADGNNATVGISGNTVQSGTPTPDNPIMPEGTGDKTGNLFDGQLQQGYYTYYNGVYVLSDTYVCTHLIPCTDNATYTFRCINTGGGAKNYGYVFFDSSQNRIGDDYINAFTEGDVVTHTATTPQNTAFLAINIAYGRRQASVVRPSDITNFMLNTGSTAKPYEPHGIKIPISSASTTTPVYLGEVESTRKIKKWVLTGDNSETYTYDSQYSRFVRVVSDAYAVGTRKTQCYCSHYNCVYHEESIDDVPDNSIYINYQQAGTQLCIKTTSYTTIEDFKSYLQQQYANGTPVTVWYVLATETTGIVNEPLCKIGDYADEVSGITIPTITGADSFDVLTTLKPSEVELTYTGWHDATVKEKSENVMPFASAQTIVNNGVTFVSDGMGQYTVNGTATADASADFDIPEFTIPVSVGAGGQGTFSLFNDNFWGNDGNVIEFYNNTTLIDAWSLHLDNRTSTTYVAMSGKKCNRIRIVVPSGVGVDHKTVKPMFTNNSTLPSAYEPYWT